MMSDHGGGNAFADFYQRLVMSMSKDDAETAVVSSLSKFDLPSVFRVFNRGEYFTVHGDDAGGPRIERPVRVSHEIRLFGGVAADWHVHDKPVILIVQGEQALADGFKAGV